MLTRATYSALLSPAAETPLSFLHRQAGNNIQVGQKEPTESA